jgi:putative transposase
MPNRADTFVPGQYYHIYNRGAAKEPIFSNQGNYEYLLQLVRRYQKKYSVTVLAYCLMPNHYHLLLRQETDEPLSKFINVLFNAYVQAVNIQQKRKGTLFEGRYKHIRIDRWEYLIHLCRYIHRNPVKARLATKPEDWPFSNYRDWIGLRNGTLKDDTFIRDHFMHAQNYLEFVNDFQDDQRNYEKISNYTFD